MGEVSNSGASCTLGTVKRQQRDYVVRGRGCREIGGWQCRKHQEPSPIPQYRLAQHIKSTETWKNINSHEEDWSQSLLTSHCSLTTSQRAWLPPATYRLSEHRGGLSVDEEGQVVSSVRYTCCRRLEWNHSSWLLCSFHSCIEDKAENWNSSRWFCSEVTHIKKLSSIN